MKPFRWSLLLIPRRASLGGNPSDPVGRRAVQPLPSARHAPSWALRLTLWLAAAMLAACASAPPAGRSGPASSGERDGPHAQPPEDLASVPDAEPTLEPLRSGGPNKPYEILGRSYVPMAQDRPFTERGLASWYGRKFHGRRTASGEVYNMYAMTAAHPTLPIPSYVRVRNPANGREVVVRVNDRGPFHPGRIIDLSYTAAFKLGVLKRVAPVEIARITFDEIRTGAWRQRGAPDTNAGGDATSLASGGPSTSETAQAQIGAPAAAPSRLAAEAASPAAAANPVSAIEPTETAAVWPGADPAGVDAPSTARPARGFWVQLGAFRQREGAEGFHRRVAADLDWLAPLLGVFSEAAGFRLQAGPYVSRDEAHSVAKRVRDALKLVPVVVERR